MSIRNRPALFTDIGHTIISLLAVSDSFYVSHNRGLRILLRNDSPNVIFQDFRKYSYSLPSVRGLMIHMEDRLTTILLPRNRYDQVMINVGLELSKLSPYNVTTVGKIFVSSVPGLDRFSYHEINLCLEKCDNFIICR